MSRSSKHLFWRTAFGDSINKLTANFLLSSGPISEKDVVGRRLRKSGQQAKLWQRRDILYGPQAASKVDSEALAQIFNASVTIGAFPKRWKTSRIKPLWKEGNPKDTGQLPSCQQWLLEGVVAERIDRYAGDRGLAHGQIHGFLRQLCAKCGKFRAKLHREMICQSGLLLT